jgi:hypothetical protein
LADDRKRSSESHPVGPTEGGSPRAVFPSSCTLGAGRFRHFIVVVYEEIDESTVYPISAYAVAE